MGILHIVESAIRPSAWQAVIGGVLLHLSLGSIYLWGNIGFYVTSYLRYCGHDVQTKDTFLIFSSALFGESITFLSSGFLHRTLSCRQLALVGGLLLAISTLLTSFMTTLFSYTITYGVLFGMSIGISYTAPISICFSWLPDHKGLVSGVILAGFGGGAILFNILASYVVNPQNLQPIDSPDGKFFGPDVSARVPKMFVVLGCCHLALVSCSNLLLRPPPILKPCSYESIDSDTGFSSSNDVLEQSRITEKVHLVENDSARQVEYSPAQLPYLLIFWVLAFTLILTSAGGLIVSGTYKKFGMEYFNDDAFLTSVGSASSLVNAFGRIFWGGLSDKIGFFNALILNVSSQAILLATFVFVGPMSPYTFLLWVCFIMGSAGGTFALYPVAAANILGKTHAGANYSIMIGIFALLVGPFTWGLERFPETSSYLFSAGICTLGGIILVICKFKL